MLLSHQEVLPHGVTAFLSHQEATPSTMSLGVTGTKRQHQVRVSCAQAGTRSSARYAHLACVRPRLSDACDTLIPRALIGMSCASRMRQARPRVSEMLLPRASHVQQARPRTRDAPWPSLLLLFPFPFFPFFFPHASHPPPSLNTNNSPNTQSNNNNNGF